MPDGVRAWNPDIDGGQDEIERIGRSGKQSDPLNSGSTYMGKQPPATRPMDHLRRKPRVDYLTEHGQGFLTDHSGNYEVLLEWHLNENADKDKIFKLTVDGKECYIDLEELLYYTRVMFETRRK